MSPRSSRTSKDSAARKPESPAPQKQVEDSTGFLLSRAANLWQREIRKALEPLDLTHTQFLVLSTLVRITNGENSVTQISLAAETGMDAMTTSSVVRTLEARGLIDRTAHASDSRARLLALTSEGRTLSAQAAKVVEKFDKRFFSALDTKIQKFNQRLLTLLKEETASK